MTAFVDVAGVDGAREARSRPETRRAIRTAGQLLQLRELDHLGAIDADAVLAVLLRPVERAVGEADQLVPTAALNRERRHAGADRDLLCPLELHVAEALHDRGRRRERRGLVVLGQQDGELVTSEPEGLAALSQACRELREDTVSGRMAVLVVDSL